jgi:hypothetical protein
MFEQSNNIIYSQFSNISGNRQCFQFLNNHKKINTNSKYFFKFMIETIQLEFSVGKLRKVRNSIMSLYKILHGSKLL